MPPAPIIHLKVRTPYSLAEGALSIKKMLGLCQKHNMPAVGVCDTNNLFGALEFAATAAKAGIQPIIGCALKLTPPDGTSEAPRSPATRLAASTPDRLFLYAQNETGYKNLLWLVSRAYIDSAADAEPQVPFPLLTDHTDGLLALSGSPLTTLGRLLGTGREDLATAHLNTLNTLFPDRLYLEVPRHDLAEEHTIEPRLIDLAHAQGLPLVAVNDVYYADESMQTAHDVLLGIAEGRTISDPHRRTSNPHFRFKSPDEMRLLYEDLPEALANTSLFARRCAYMPEGRKPILPAYADDEAESLRHKATEGLDWRLERYVFLPGMNDAHKDTLRQKYRERLDFEINVISGMGFAGYFLIVSDFIQWAKGQDIPVGPGRGSGAGSLVAWALQITDLDPIRLNLLFERFLNPERVSMPDFDIDFCQDRRDEVIRYVQEKYGFERVAQIITFGKLQARAALRDVGRVLELPYSQVDRICKLVPNNPANPVTLAEAIDGEPQLQALQQEDDTRDLMSISLQLEGLYRHASTHAAGVVIGDRPLHELVPLYRDPRSPMPVTQFNMKDVEKAGLVKFDFLGLKTLSVLHRAVAMIHARTGRTIDLLNLPPADEKAFALLARGESTGVFQLESTGMRDVLRNLKPDRFEDIIAVVALYRPGPMDNIPQYIACKHCTEQPDYLHPKLEPILRETFGIMIYQEQVMQAAQVLAGYSLGGADLLRRAMGKKIKEEMDQQRATFVDGCGKNGIGAAKSNEIFDQIAKFAGYGFNKSHAAAYALIAYQTAWLKAHYPVAFFAASMAYEMSNTDKLDFFYRELQSLQIPVFPPDVNLSEASFSVGVGCRVWGMGDQPSHTPHPIPQAQPEGRTPHTLPLGVRYALGAIKGVGEAAMAELVRERTANGPFVSLFDLTRRLSGKGLNKRILENLTAAGAFDSLHPNRAAVSASIESALVWGNADRDADKTQDTLFGSAGVVAEHAPQLADVPEWSPLDKLAREHGALGFYLSAHPLDSYRATLEKMDITLWSSVEAALAERPTKRLQLAGIPVARKERRSQKGSKYAFVQFSDPTGVFEVMMFSEALAAARDLLDAGAPLVVTVDISEENGGLRLTGQGVKPLDQLASRAALGVEIALAAPEPVATIRALLAGEQAGPCPVRFRVAVAPDRVLLLTLPQKYRLSEDTRRRLRTVPGVLGAVDY
jgi:DNA polymerase-3 subunit alpha